MKNYARIEDGVVVNIICLTEENVHEVPNVVDVGDYLIDIGDTYSDGVFYRNRVKVITFEEYKDQLAQNRLLEEMDEAYREGVNSV